MIRALPLIVNSDFSQWDNTQAILTEIEPIIFQFFLMSFICIWIGVIYRAILYRWASVGCLDAVYLYYKRHSGPLSSRRKRRAAIALLQKAADSGSYRAMRALSRLYAKGKHLTRDLSLSEVYSQRAEAARGGRLARIKSSPLSFVLNILIVLILICFYLTFDFSAVL